MLRVGDPLPELVVETVDGAVDLRGRFAGRALVVAFMRHFG